MPTPRRSHTIAIGIGAVAALAITGCSSNSNSNPSQSPTPTQSSSSASPSGSTTGNSNITKFTVKSGSVAKVAGGSTWTASGGTMIVTATGSGLLAGNIEVAAKGTANQRDWLLSLKVDGDGNVESGSLTSPGTMYKVTGTGGKINYLSTGTGTTLVTIKSIPIQQGTDTPTTMTLSVTGNR